MVIGILQRGVLVALLLAFAGVFTTEAGAIIHFVKPGGTGSGTSWEEAGSLQATVTAAAAGDEIWVAAGTYTATQNPVLIMKEGVALYGGFLVGAISGEERNWTANPTIIDGENVRGCVRGANNARLDGFTITHGKWTALGGGLSNDAVSPTVANCTFTGNWGGYGGGIYKYKTSPVITDCIFNDNYSDWDGGAIYNEMSSPEISGCLFNRNTSLRRGGGMYNNAALPEVSDCIFMTNTAAVSGGGMYNEEASPIVSRCSFEENIAERGAGMYICEESMPIVSHCTFILNVADFSGGGIGNISSSPTLIACKLLDNMANQENGGGINNVNASLIMKNCLVAGNSAQKRGGGIYNELSTVLTITQCTITANITTTEKGGGIYNLQSEPELTNCILWGNFSLDGQLSNIEENQVSEVAFSCIGNGYAGTGNIDSDPLFLDVSGGDFRLQADSLCIDAGTDINMPDDDIQGIPRPQGSGYDMGAYEYIEGTPHPADLDENYRIVMSEAISYLSGWQQGTNPMTHAIRAVYLWQVGEYYRYDPEETDPLCWTPWAP